MFDTLLLIGFVFVYADDFTGLGLHEWIGIAFGVALLVHLSLHWDWVLRTTRLMLTTSGRRQFMWVLNFMLAIDLILCIGSGIVISGLRIFGVTFSGEEFWAGLHGNTAGVAIALIGIHIGLDWRWAMNALRRMTTRSFQPMSGPDDEE
ncbi:MAG: cytochrome b/b6 domain-containing protein [Acidimicrobiales bacterium]